MLKYSLTSNLANPITLNGATLPTGQKSFIFTDVVAPKTPLHFGLDGVFQTRNESSAPFEYLGTNTPATFTDGTHKIEVKDSTGAIIDSATFTSGSGTPPDLGTKEQVKVTVNLSKVEIILINDPSL